MRSLPGEERRGRLARNSLTWSHEGGIAGVGRGGEWLGCQAGPGTRAGPLSVGAVAPVPCPHRLRPACQPGPGAEPCTCACRTLPRPHRTGRGLPRGAASRGVPGRTAARARRLSAPLPAAPRGCWEWTAQSRPRRCTCGRAGGWVGRGAGRLQGGWRRSRPAAVRAARRALGVVAAHPRGAGTRRARRGGCARAGARAHPVRVSQQGTPLMSRRRKLEK